MELFSVTVAGFRRFREPATLKTDGKLVALVGPNEAGKSSLLSAIVHLGHDEVPQANEFSRGFPKEKLKIHGRYFLDGDDLNASQLVGPRWLHVTKTAEGARQFEISPPPNPRDLSLRGKVLTILNFVLSNKRFLSKVHDAIFDVEARAEAVEVILGSNDEDLSSDDIELVSALFREFEEIVDDRDPATIKNMHKIVSDWVQFEEQPNPTTVALAVLRNRLPNIILFDQDDRDLKSEYSFSELEDELPDALENLSEIAKLDIKNLIEKYREGDAAELTTLEHAENRNLEGKFGENWKQAGVRVSLRILEESISIQAVNEKSEFTSFAERSDGLRQFVALQSFATCNWSGSPILLIDEAEQKLHYDAQADLVQMLARQNVASKVVFTTHSAGCLPEDLGNGVRFARPAASDKTRSEIVNKFWAENEAGFAPLLFGMGASTLAFFPTRYALVVEGPSDMLLLPTLLREALSTEVLGFQCIPGLSTSKKAIPGELLGKKTGVFYLVDGDEGGSQIRRQLTEFGVERSNIITLKNTDSSAVELEDFIDPGILIEAVNNLLNKFHGAVSPIKKSDLKSKNRMSNVKIWYKNNTSSEIPKVELAYEILGLRSDNPSRIMIDQKRLASFRSLAEGIMESFSSIKK